MQYDKKYAHYQQIKLDPQLIILCILRTNILKTINGKIINNLILKIMKL
jgi:hypothetical protein